MTCREKASEIVLESEIYKTEIELLLERALQRDVSDD